MTRCALILGLVLAQSACSSKWSLDVNAAVACTPDRELAWWVDADGDGWGEGTDTSGNPLDPIMACDGFQDADHVRNALDCDDALPAADTPDGSLLAVTGAVSGFCPQDIVYNPDDAPVSYLGFRAGEDEYIAFYGDTPVDFGSLANANCGAWGPLDGAGTPTAHLATFESITEVAAVMAELEAVLAGQPYAAFIGITPSDGPDNVDGWDWQVNDGASPEVFTTIGWCDGVAPDVGRVSQVALVYDGASWCLGAADLARAPYTAYTAHYVCERPSPNPADYNYFPPIGG